MKVTGSKKVHLPNAVTTGIFLFVLAIFLSFIKAELSTIPLAGFVLLCTVLPFFPRFGFFLPVISRGTSGERAVTLTFDDGPDPLTTPYILHLLYKYTVKATFFVSGKNARLYPELIRKIILDGHAVGNHSYSHDNFIMLKRSRKLQQEIESTQSVLRELGVAVFSFRPPVGITSPRLGPILDKNGMYAVNFSCRAFDGGNRWVKTLSKKILDRIHPDDIVLLHDVMPKEQKNFYLWKVELEKILAGLKNRGFDILPLSEIIKKPVNRIEIDGREVFR